MIYYILGGDERFPDDRIQFACDADTAIAVAKTSMYFRNCDVVEVREYNPRTDEENFNICVLRGFTRRYNSCGTDADRCRFLWDLFYMTTEQNMDDGYDFNDYLRDSGNYETIYLARKTKAGEKTK